TLAGLLQTEEREESPAYCRVPGSQGVSLFLTEQLTRELLAQKGLLPMSHSEKLVLYEQDSCKVRGLQVPVSNVSEQAFGLLWLPPKVKTLEDPLSAGSGLWCRGMLRNALQRCLLWLHRDIKKCSPYIVNNPTHGSHRGPSLCLVRNIHSIFSIGRMGDVAALPNFKAVRHYRLQQRAISHPSCLLFCCHFFAVSAAEKAGQAADAVSDMCWERLIKIERQNTSLSQVAPAVLVQKTWMSLSFIAVRKEETKWIHGNGSGSLSKENKALTKDTIQGCSTRASEEGGGPFADEM
ncbi:hypothetical protein EK904_006355, partial [Melospiza melodia maxima]